MQIVVLLLFVFLVMTVFVGGLTFALSRTNRRPPARASDPAGVRTYVRFLGAERYMGPDESVEEAATCGRGILEKLYGGMKAAHLRLGNVVDGDWGALLEVANDGERLLICSGYRGEDWLVYVCSPRGPQADVRDTEILRRVLTSIDESLKTLPGIEGVAWHRAERWSAGQESDGAPQPLSA